MNALPPVTCRACGTENRPTRLFCSNCGAYLQAEGEDTWEELPLRDVVPPVDPASEPQPAPRAPPTGRRRGEGRSRTVGVVLLLLLLAVAAALGALVYATLLPGRGAGGDGVVTTAGVSASSTTARASESTASSAVSGTTLARGPALSPTSVEASSVLPPENGITYDPNNLFDNSLETAWQENAAGNGVGEWVRFGFGHKVTLSAIEIANGYQKGGTLFSANPRVQTLRVEYSDGTTQQVRLYDDTGFQEITPASKPTEWLRLTILSVYPGDTWDDTGFSEVRLYEIAR